MQNDMLKITTLIVKIIPLAVLCSMTSLVMLTGTDMLISIMSFAGTFVLALAVMLGMFRTAVNSTGDVAVSLIVAKTEKLLDTEQYYS